VKHEVSTDVNFSRVSKMLYLSSVTLILQLESRDVKAVNSLSKLH